MTGPGTCQSVIAGPFCTRQPMYSLGCFGARQFMKITGNEMWFGVPIEQLALLADDVELLERRPTSRQMDEPFDQVHVTQHELDVQKAKQADHQEQVAVFPATSGQCVGFRLERPSGEGMLPCFPPEGLGMYRIQHSVYSFDRIWGFVGSLPFLSSTSGRIVNRDEFYTAFKHDIITSAQARRAAQRKADHAGLRYRAPSHARDHGPFAAETSSKPFPHGVPVVTRLDIKHMRDVVELRLELNAWSPSWRRNALRTNSLGSCRNFVEKSIPAPTAAMRRPRGCAIPPAPV